jgi:hypothetical protein
LFTLVAVVDRRMLALYGPARTFHDPPTRSRVSLVPVSNHV